MRRGGVRADRNAEQIVFGFGSLFDRQPRTRLRTRDDQPGVGAELLRRLLDKNRRADIALVIGGIRLGEITCQQQMGDHERWFLGPVVPGPGHRFRAKRRQEHHHAPLAKTLLHRQWRAVAQARDHACRRVGGGRPVTSGPVISRNRDAADKRIVLA